MRYLADREESLMTTEALPVRSTDPDTSREAASIAMGRAGTIRPIVLALVREHGPLTHDELIGQYHRLMIIDPKTPKASESGLRTRLSELVRRGLIREDATRGKSLFGNTAKRWVAVDPAELIAAGDSTADTATNADSPVDEQQQNSDDAAESD